MTLGQQRHHQGLDHVLLADDDALHLADGFADQVRLLSHRSGGFGHACVLPGSGWPDRVRSGTSTFHQMPGSADEHAPPRVPSILPGLTNRAQVWCPTGAGDTATTGVLRLILMTATDSRPAAVPAQVIPATLPL